MGISEKEYRQLLANSAAAMGRETLKAGDSKPAADAERSMNSWEAEYAHLLEVRKLAGEIVWWAFEPMRLRIGKGAFYKPDFGVKLASGETEFVEIKGRDLPMGKLKRKQVEEIFGIKVTVK